MKTEEEYIEDADFEQKSVGGWKDKISGFLGGSYFVPIVIILVAVIAFSLGRISAIQDKRPPVRITNNSTLTPLLQQEGGTGGATQPASSDTLKNTASAVSATTQTNSSGTVVASKNGTKYHYPWCAGAKQISAQNLITFNSIEEARAAGYSPATNCKGLK